MALQAGRVGVHPSQVDLLGKIKMLPFIKRIAPWQIKGKWYAINVTYVASSNTLTTDSSLFTAYATTSELSIIAPANFVILDTVIDDIPKDNYKNITTVYRRGFGGNNNVMYMYLGASSDITHDGTFTVYIYGYYKKATTPALLSDTPVQSVRKVAKASKVDEPVEETTEPIEEPINTDTE